MTPAGVFTIFTDASIYYPQAIAAGPDGNLWFTTPYRKSIGKISTTGVVSSYTDPSLNASSSITWGPDGQMWFTNGSNSVGSITTAGVVSSYTDPSILSPTSITVGPDANLWFTNGGSNSIGRITTAGMVANFPGTGAFPRTIVAAPDGNLWFTNESSSVGRITTTGTITNYPTAMFSHPNGIAVGSDGNLWYTSAASPSGGRGDFSVGRMTPLGAFTTFADPSGIASPGGMAAGPDGNLWFTNLANDSIGRVTPTGVVSNFVGEGIYLPWGITAGPDGNLWFTNAGGSIGRITPAGVVSNFRAPGVENPRGITAGPDGNLWFTIYGGSGRGTTIGRITPTGVISTFTGVGIDGPRWIAAGADGNLWFSNFGNNSIGRITTAGVVSNFPGADGPVGMTSGPDGNVWFTNYTGNSIGRITPAGSISTFTGPRISAPGSITKAADGNLWFTNGGGQSIGRITPTGVVTDYYSPSVSGPWGSAAGPDGNVWFTNNFSSSIGRVAMSGSAFHSLSPSRLLDSRTGLGGWPSKLTAGTVNGLTVTGGVVPTTASAVVVNVTATDSDAGSFVTVFPGGAPTPQTSNLNFAPGETIANLVTVGVGTNGQIAFATAIGSTHVVADLVGYYDDGTSPGDLYNGLTPMRLLDSRTPNGGWKAKLAQGAPRDLYVRQPANATGVPPTATAVVANVTITAGSRDSYVSVWPSGSNQPNSSNLNFAAGQSIPNLAIVKIGSNSAIRFANEVGEVDVVVDILGYFDSTSGSLFHSIDPTRILDGRVDLGVSGSWGPQQARTLQVAGAPGTNVPVGSTDVVANVTATSATRGSFVSVYPGGGPRPNSSNLNFGPGQTIPNLVTTKLSSNGSTDLYNQSGNVDLIADIVGYYAPN